MARSCPACSRLNGDKAKRCLYCSAPLPERSERGTPSASAEDRPAALDRDRHLIILIPSGAPSDDATESFSEIAGLSRYDARLSLSATRPRLFRRVSEAVGREISGKLKASRIPHYVVSERSVRDLPVSRTRYVTLHDRHFEAGVDGAKLSIPYAELLLLVRGEISRERYDKNKLGSRRGVSRELSPGMRLHIYAREASVTIEIDPETFDWSALGPDRSDSALLNLERLLSDLTKEARSATLDRGFDREPVVLSSAQSNTDVESVLHNTELGASGVVRDNETQFRFYSRWRYRLERHLARQNAK